ncbi:hypothetical protein U9M48_041866 [Paspalum notatum var. saurae]|uniref:Uncharacterized protein n=1 Tax=Paspalum notatum var. saurae TaxID=547442 RepID=A0AAQ3URH7_PASNO
MRARHSAAVSASKDVAVAPSFGGRPRLIVATSDGVNVKVRVTISPGGGGGGGGAASNSRWGKELAGPCRRHGRRGEAPGELGHGGHELGEAGGVADGVIEPEREDEAAAEETCYLQGGGEHGAGAVAVDVGEELVHARERRAERVPGRLQLLQPHVGVGLHEQHPLAGAVHHQLPRLHLPQPPRERVERHQRAAERAPDHARGVVGTAAAVVEEEERHVPAQSVLVVDVGQALRLARRRRGRADELRLPTSTHSERELRRRRRHGGRRLDVLRCCFRHDVRGVKFRDAAALVIC